MLLQVRVHALDAIGKWMCALGCLYWHSSSIFGIGVLVICDPLPAMRPIVKIALRSLLAFGLGTEGASDIVVADPNILLLGCYQELRSVLCCPHC